MGCVVTLWFALLGYVAKGLPSMAASCMVAKLIATLQSDGVLHQKIALSNTDRVSNNVTSGACVSFHYSVSSSVMRSSPLLRITSWERGYHQLGHFHSFVACWAIIVGCVAPHFSINSSCCIDLTLCVGNSMILRYPA